MQVKLNVEQFNRRLAKVVQSWNVRPRFRRLIQFQANFGLRN